MALPAVSTDIMSSQYQSSPLMIDLYDNYSNENDNFLAGSDLYISNEISIPGYQDSTVYSNNSPQLTNSSTLSSPQSPHFDFENDAFFEEPRFVTQSSQLHISNSSSLSSTEFPDSTKQDTSLSTKLFDFGTQASMTLNMPSSSAFINAKSQTISPVNTLESGNTETTKRRNAADVASSSSRRPSTQRRCTSSSSKAASSSSTLITSRKHRRPTRQPHNLVEQRYRDSLNAEIKRLQMAIPHLSGSQDDSCYLNDREGSSRLQPTKATIIAAAIQYIKSIEKERDAALLAIMSQQGLNKLQARKYS